MEQFGDRIIQTEINIKHNVITFRYKAKAVLHDLYSHRDLDPEKDQLRIIETAAKLMILRLTVYPACGVVVIVYINAVVVQLLKCMCPLLLALVMP